MYEPRYLRHHITNVSADDLHGDELKVKANYTVIQVLQDELPQILSTGRYIDKVISEQGVLRFKQKWVVYDSVLVPNSLIYPI